MQVECIDRENCTDCVYGKYSDWSSCSKTCGGGTKKKERTILQSRIGCDTTDTIIEACNVKPCPPELPPQWNSWNPWSPCTGNCTYSFKIRTRECPGPEACEGESLESEACDTECESEYDCDPEHEDYIECANQMVNCSDIACISMRLPEICADIDTDKCIPGCVCKGGKVYDDNMRCVEKNTCPCYLDTDGTAVGITDTVDKDCNTCLCNYDGSFTCTEKADCCEILSSWTSWTDCSSICGEGSQKRFRNGTSGCNDSQLEEEKDCTGEDCTPACIIGGKEYQLNEFIDNPPNCSKCYCAEMSITIEGVLECIDDEKAIVDGVWLPWTEWTNCNSSCEDGTRSRGRICQDAQCGGEPCVGDEVEYENCNQNISCCKTGEWKPWSNCSKECDGGKQTRTRDLENEDDLEECLERGTVLEQSQDCNADPCTIECEMGPWSEFSECTRLCDGGVQEKTRTITKVADDCNQLNDTEERECNTHRCEECGDNMTYKKYKDCEIHHCDEVNFESSPKSCGEEKIGCACDEGFFMNDNDECVPQEKCSECELDGIVFSEGQSYPDPKDECKNYTCIKGQFVPTDQCVEPRCSDDQVLKKEEGECCAKCVDLEDTPEYCTAKDVTKKYEFEDSNGNYCVSNDTITLRMCIGRCKTSMQEPKLMFEGGSLQNSVCECCRATEHGERISIYFDCTNSETPVKMTLQTIKSCGCTVECKEYGEVNSGLPDRRRR